MILLTILLASIFMISYYLLFHVDAQRFCLILYNLLYIYIYSSRQLISDNVLRVSESMLLVSFLHLLDVRIYNYHLPHFARPTLLTEDIHKTFSRCQRVYLLTIEI